MASDQRARATASFFYPMSFWTPERLEELAEAGECLFIIPAETDDCRPGVVVAVNCNDFFAWASADRELVPPEEWDRVVYLHANFGVDGALAWASVRRGDPPQGRWVEKYPGILPAIEAARKEAA